MSFIKKDTKGDLSSIQTSSSLSSSSIQNSAFNASSFTSTKRYGSSTGSIPNTRNIKPSQRNKNGSQHSKRYNKNHNNKPQLFDDTDDFFLEKSVLKSSKKGIDISHLLEFNLPAHSNEADGHSNNINQTKNRRSSKKKTSQLQLTGRNYINASYKFVVDYKNDYKAQILDPNLPLDDSSIIRVIINKNDYQCPICLSENFVAPRMTRCGHVLCYSCLLSLFDSIETIKATDNRRVSCPLCNEDIREKHKLLPVLIGQTDIKSEKPEINKFIDLTLMYRPSSRVYSQPIQFYLESKQFSGDIPWVSRNCNSENFFRNSKFIQFARLMKCDLNFVLSCYQKEIDDLMIQKIIDKELYGDPGVFYDLAKLKIESEMGLISDSMIESNAVIDGPEIIPDDDEVGDERSLIESFDKLYIKQLNGEIDNLIPNDEKGYFYYQYGFNSKVKYFLSSLDVQILKTIYGDYNRFPFKISMKLENINYEDSVITSEMIHKLKYLGHLPMGTEVAFLELDWSNSNLSAEVYSQFKKKLKDRSRFTKSKRLKDDRNKVNFDRELEFKTLQFYSSENNLDLEHYGYKLKLENEFKHIESMPALGHSYPGIGEDEIEKVNNSNNSSDSSNNKDENNEIKYDTTVWGTKIPMVEEPEPEEVDEELETMLKLAKEEQLKNSSGKGKKKRGKKIILSFN